MLNVLVFALLLSLTASCGQHAAIALVRLDFYKRFFQFPTFKKGSCFVRSTLLLLQDLFPKMGPSPWIR